MSNNHPAAEGARHFVMSLDVKTRALLLKTFHHTLTAFNRGNPTAKACYLTLQKLEAGEKCSDAEVLGLAWTVRDLFDKEGKK